MKFKDKMKALERLKEFGIRDEKQLATANFEELIKMPGVSVPELKVIAEIKKNTKSNKLLKYLLEDDEERRKADDEEQSIEGTSGENGQTV